MVPPTSHKVSRVSWYSGSCRSLLLSSTRLSLSLAGLPSPFHEQIGSLLPAVIHACTHAGLGSSGFARRYSRNHCCFLFLWLLRCFSSPGSPPYVMDWRKDTGGLLQWVSPFRHLRIIGYLLLPEAFRSLSRLSSALSAKASTICSFHHDQNVDIALSTLVSRFVPSFKGTGIRFFRNVTSDVSFL